MSEDDSVASCLAILRREGALAPVGPAEACTVMSEEDFVALCIAILRHEQTRARMSNALERGDVPHAVRIAVEAVARS